MAVARPRTVPAVSRRWPPSSMSLPSTRRSQHRLHHTTVRHSPHRIQHRLDIRRRAGDDAQNFTRRRLLLQRLLEFLNSRTFSMAITAWSAKVSRSLICAGVKGRTSMRRAVSLQWFPLLTKRNGQKGARAAEKPTSGNRSARGRRECGACHARASSEIVAHQY